MELLSLKWSNHKITFFHVLSSFRKKEVHTDVTLSCGNKFYPAHKLVLSSCSDYFSEVFERTSCKSPVIILKDISSNTIECILDYMYLGEVDVKQSDLASLIQAAECLQIKGLAMRNEDPPCSKRKISSPDGISPKRSRHESSRISSNVSHSKQILDTNSSSRSLEKSSSPLIAVETIQLEKETYPEDTQSQYEQISYLFGNVKDSFSDNVDFDADLPEFSKEELDESLAGPSNKQNENSWTGSEGNLETTIQQPKMAENRGRSAAREIINIQQRVDGGSDNERPYRYPHSDYKAARKPTLDSRMRLHSGEEPFRCPHCSYAVRQKSNFVTHLRLHAGDK